ncbi:LytTr DNA-binding domain protein [Algimonas arctica]|uniref:LytTr DNA-binding domain protein n=1 Tax=Algimonas arctica TaxID=1479486 RepID=A0A8J3CR72_9PROT|nr:LytTR family DNA-binding domain-containing protein [Algimonas arctica]GHB00051.1 LytTr DNA-binding domain protein [Algimonas arctica]
MTGPKAQQNNDKSGWPTRIFANRVLSNLVTPVIAGSVLTVLAPFGTHRLDLAWRALYWVSLCLAGGLGALAAHQLMLRFKLPVVGWRHTLVQSFGSTVAVAPFVIAGFANYSPRASALTLFYIWVIAIVITVVAELAGRSAAKEALNAEARPALMDRLPLHLRDAALYAAMSEDHYVRLHTSAGDHLILMRLGDVDGLAKPLAGLSPHRSWWVAEQGVTEVRRRGGKMLIALKDGTDVPVSRAGAARVKAAGWLR